MTRRKPAVKYGTYYMYLRKSRKDIERERWGEGETLARHEQHLDEVCERDGYPVERKFREVVSGESISERKEFQKLMELVKRREVTGVVVHAVDRLGRGSIDEYGWVLATLQRTRTLVITPGKVYDPTDQADYMALVMLMIISAGELAAQKERYREGKNRSAKNGEHIANRAPYGYDKARVDRKNTLVPNAKADVVRMIFAEVASHKHLHTLARELNGKGVKTSTGKAWYPTTIRRVIENPVYKGMIQWGETRVETLDRDGFDDRKRQVLQDKDDVILVPGLHEPIVSEELWQAANDAMEKSPRNTFASKLRNPLAGLLRCAKCGKAATYQSSDHTPKAKTSRYRHVTHTFCDGWLSCDADDLIAMVVDSLMDIAGEFELRTEKGEDEARKHEEELAALHAELASVRRQSERLIDLYTAEPPAITIEAFRRRNFALEKQADALERRIGEVESADPPDYRVLSANVREVAGILKDPKQDAEYKNAMLKRVVDRIEMVNHAKVICHDDVELHIFLRQ